MLDDLFYFFIIGGIFLISFYHFFLYLFRNKDISSFYFSIGTLLIALSGLVSKQKYLIFMSINPELSFDLLTRIDYFCTFLSIPFYLSFISSLYPEQSQKLIILIVFALCIIFTLTTLLFSIPVQREIFKIYGLIMLFAFSYSTFIVIKAAFKKKWDAYIILTGVFFVLVSVSTEIHYLYHPHAYRFNYLTSTFILIGCQAIAIAFRFSKTFYKVEELTGILEEKNLSLTRLDKIKDEFLANTSHELRTPLNGIIGIAESLADGAAGNLSKTVKSNLDLIISSGRRLSHLVNDLLDFSRLKNRDIQIKPKAVDLRSIVSIILKLLKPLSGNKEIKFINAIKKNN